MKKIYYLLTFLALVCLANNAKAKIWTLDNSPGAGADFTTFIAAVNGASDGDSILIMPTLTNYTTGVNITKKLYIYSRGAILYNPIDKDKRPQINGDLSFNNGSSGSIFSGILLFGRISLNGGGVKITNSYITSGFTFSSNNNIVEGNVVQVGYTTIVFSFSTGVSHNLVLNNYCTKGWDVTFSHIDFKSHSTYSFIFGGNSTNLISNNYFGEVQRSGSLGTGFSLTYSSNVDFQNNIVWSNATNRDNFQNGSTGVNYRNNITYSVKTSVDTLPGTGNYNDTLPEFETLLDSSNATYNLNNNMRLKQNTVGVNGGTDSTDVGLYGRNYNFNMHFNPLGVAIFDDFYIINPVLKKGGVLRARATARKPD